MNRAAPGQTPLAERSYVLAILGAHLAFMPLFALLLPRRVNDIAPGSAVAVLSWLLLVGGIVASVAHIAAGKLSDHWFARVGQRRGLVGIGTAAVVGAYLFFAWATDIGSLFAAMIIFQLALNLMFAPLGAMLADHVADDRKGRVAAMMNSALPLSAIGTTLAALLFPRDGAGGFLFIAALSASAAIPLIVAPRFATASAAPIDVAPARPMAWPDFARVWAARLLMQSGAAFLLNFFYLFVASRPAVTGLAASRAFGILAALSMIASVSAALLAGSWSDKRRTRRWPMIGGALACALSLAILAAADSWPMMILGYVLFNAGLTTFLSADSALVAQLLGHHPRRGEYLGYMNLTNTLPAIVVPALALGVLARTPQLDWSLGFSCAAMLALAAGLLVTQIRTID